MLNHVTVRPAKYKDAVEIARIYNQYITNTVVTFEEDEVTPAEMAGRMDAVQSESLPWLICEIDGVVAGYAYAGRWHSRSAYRFTVESTVYLSPDHTGCALCANMRETTLNRFRVEGLEFLRDRNRRQKS